MTDRQTDIEADLFARVMALPSSLRHDVLKFIGATRSGCRPDHPIGRTQAASEPANDPFSKDS